MCKTKIDFHPDHDKSNAGIEIEDEKMKNY
jgi:hypothetical protein